MSNHGIAKTVLLIVCGNFALGGCSRPQDAEVARARAEAEQAKAELAKARADAESAKTSPNDTQPAVPAKTSDARLVGKWKGVNNALTLEFSPGGDLKAVDTSTTILPTGNYTYEVYVGGFLNSNQARGLSSGGFQSYLWKYTITGDQLSLQPVLNWKGDVAGDAWRFNKLN